MKYALLDLPTRVDAAVGNAARAEAAGLDRYAAASADEIAVILQGTPAEREAGWAMIEEGLA